MINISHKYFEIVNDLLHRRFKSKYKKFLFFVKLLGRKCKVPRSNMKKVTIETRVYAVSRETKHEKSRVVYLRVLDNLWESVYPTAGEVGEFCFMFTIFSAFTPQDFFVVKRCKGKSKLFLGEKNE